MRAYFVVCKVSMMDKDSSKEVKSGTIYIPDAKVQLIPRNGTFPGITKLDDEEFRLVSANPTTYREMEYSKKDLAVIKKVQREQNKVRRSIDSIVNRGWKAIRQV